MIAYQTLLIIHVVATIGLVGPLMLTPRWLGSKGCDVDGSALHKLHQQTAFAGWVLLLSGLALLYLQDWNWLRTTWMQLSIGLYIGTQAIDHWWADPQEHLIERGADISAVKLRTWLIFKLIIFLSIVALMISKPTSFA